MLSTLVHRRMILVRIHLLISAANRGNSAQDQDAAGAVSPQRGPLSCDDTSGQLSPPHAHRKHALQPGYVNKVLQHTQSCSPLSAQPDVIAVCCYIDLLSGNVDNIDE